MVLFDVFLINLTLFNEKNIFIAEKAENGFSAHAEDFGKHLIVTMGDDLPQLKKIS